MHSKGVTEDEWKLLECLQAAPAPLKDFLEAKAAEPSPFWGLMQRGYLDVDEGRVVVGQAGEGVLRGAFVRLADGSQVWRQQGIGGSSAQ